MIVVYIRVLRLISNHEKFFKAYILFFLWLHFWDPLRYERISVGQLNYKKTLFSRLFDLYQGCSRQQ